MDVPSDEDVQDRLAVEVDAPRAFVSDAQSVLLPRATPGADQGAHGRAQALSRAGGHAGAAGPVRARPQGAGGRRQRHLRQQGQRRADQRGRAARAALHHRRADRALHVLGAASLPAAGHGHQHHELPRAGLAHGGVRRPTHARPRRHHAAVQPRVRGPAARRGAGGPCRTRAAGRMAAALRGNDDRARAVHCGPARPQHNRR